MDFLEGIASSLYSPYGNVGELFIEDTTRFMMSISSSNINKVQWNNDVGAGLRLIDNDVVKYLTTNDIGEAGLNDLILKAGVCKNNKSNNITYCQNIKQYYDINSDCMFSVDEAKNKLQEIDSYLRQNDKVVDVNAMIISSRQKVNIVTYTGKILFDIRPMVTLRISVVVKGIDGYESATSSVSGRFHKNNIDHIKIADDAIRKAILNIDAKPIKAGVYQVLLANGTPGVLLHEAVGHGLECDFIRKEVSAFCGRIGTKVAASGVTVVDDGTIENARGSINFDDEGEPSRRNVLIQDGILVGYMNDRYNAEKIKMTSSGNCRRESYKHLPMPRMTNTFMLAGNTNVSDLMGSIKNGIYAVDFGGGQVDITSGKFVFSGSEAYMVENGKISYPIKGCSIIGDGPTCLQKIIGIGDDYALDDGGTCGKDGQSVPVCTGQPSLLISDMVIGGSQ